MSAASDYLEKKWLDHLLVNTAYAPEAALHLGLFTSDPGESGAAGEFTIGSGGYARIAIVNNVVAFPPCLITGTPTKTNGIALSFPAATAAWGTATHWAIFSAATGATNMIFHGPLPTSYVIQAGQTPKIPIGAMQFTVSNSSVGGLTDYAKRKLLDLTFGASAFTPPVSIYLGVGTSLSGETISEWTDTNYARSLSAFTAATLGSGTCPNTTARTFATPSAAVGPTTLTHFGAWDDLASGNLLAVGAIASSKIISASDTAELAAGACVFSIQ